MTADHRPAFPAPTDPAASRDDVLLRYLDYFRAVLVSKLDGIADSELRSSRLPSGWTPLQLLSHLIHVERRWLEWGFEGRDVADPWGDERDGAWHVGPDHSVSDLLGALSAQADRTRAIVDAHALEEKGRPGPRWDGAEPATLERVLLHLVQEYARHVGHLDIVRELIDGRTGEE